MRSSPSWSVLLVLVASACTTVAAVEDAGPGPPVLECETPQAITLTASTDPPNAGVPTAGIGWTDGACALYEDETHPDAVLVIADLTGMFAGTLVAAPGQRWVIESSSVGGGPSSYIAPLPRDTIVDVELRHRDDAGVQLAMSFRVDGDVVTLLDMRLL